MNNKERFKEENRCNRNVAFEKNAMDTMNREIYKL